MKNRNKVILLADNDSEFVHICAESLEGRGYHVLKASTWEEAKNCLLQTHIHLAILLDEKDISGLTLAKDSTYRSIPKIILSNSPTIESVREALAPTHDGFSPAVDYINKADGPEAMIQAVEQAFTEHVHVNWDLEIQLNRYHPSLFLYLTGLVQPDTNLVMQQADELDDLFRRLFYTDQKIRLGRLFWNDRRQFCISILVQSVHQAINSYLLVCGDRQTLEQGRGIMEGLTSQTAKGTRLVNTSETTHFRANLYGLPGAEIETAQTLRDLFQTGKERSLKLKTAFVHLLGDVLKEWHRHGQILEGKQGLMSIYRQLAGLGDDEVSRGRLEERLDALIQSTHMLGRAEIRRKDRQISFQFPDGVQTFPDPLTTIYTALAQYDAPVVCKLSLGNLKAENILVDSEQRTYLTDFTHVTQAPQWWDFICLEAALRFETTQVPDLLACQEFEDCLMKPSRLDASLDNKSVIPGLSANVSLIEQVRQQAASEMGASLISYYAGLLAWVVGAISHHDPALLETKAEKLHNAHLLLAACMIARWLEQPGESADSTSAGGELRLDNDDKLWIGDRYVATFSGLRLKLLRYLYEQTGHSVSPRTIVEKVYGDKYDLTTEHNQNQGIREEISRLRKVIEPKPSQPRYILTVRKKGYCLVTSGEPEK